MSGVYTDTHAFRESCFYCITFFRTVITIDRSVRNRFIFHQMKENPEYSVHDLCKMSGVSRKTLWYYDHAGLLKPIRRSGNQKAKYYDESSLETLNQIIRYRKAGLMISEIRSIQKADAVEKQAIMKKALERLQRKKKEVEAETELLKQIISEQRDAIIITHSDEESVI